MRKKESVRQRTSKQKWTRRKKRVRSNPYARIDWEKASVLFHRPVAAPLKSPRMPSVGFFLHMLGAAGTQGLTFLFEAGSMSVFEASQGPLSYSAWKSRRLLGQLAKQKYVSITENPDSSTSVIITKDGLVRALTYELDTMKLAIPKRWDKKWRVVIFDIAEEHKKLRDLFRMRLVQLGLFQLQESVYISPYPCFGEVEFLRELYGIAFTVRYLLVQHVEDDGELKRHFGLG